MVKIFVINLPTSTERKQNISKQLDAMNLAYSIFPAVNGHTDKSPLFERYDEQKSQLYRGKSLTKGQLGCYASHYLLWEKCIKLNEPIIVLEDDALLYPDAFLDIVAHIDKLADKFECIRLFDNKRPTFSHYKIFELPHTAIHKFSRGHMSTTGYFITPQGAKKYLAHSDSWCFAVDIFMDRFWINKVDAYGTYPACLTNDPQFDSDIGYGAKKQRSLICKTKREAFNLIELVHRHYHNALYKIRSKRKS
ncbi:glycosyltransferase family 25 protein [Photobacterium leiognathi]|uniref:glycosyltransferase family 25 protein n=1 Tax=Photobacterium leiognathi TaxID=553611 RepID=UPI0027343A6F|nr:glycosyltransferase family 25 protein [Photobacterium leiognathi]